MESETPVVEMPMMDPSALAPCGITLSADTRQMAESMSDLEMKALIIETFRFAQETAGRVRRIEEFCMMLNTLMTALGKTGGLDAAAAKRIVGADMLDLAHLHAAQSAEANGVPLTRQQRRAAERSGK